MFKILNKYLSLIALSGILLFFSSVANADSIVRQVISNGGGQMTANSSTLDYTIGQPIISTDYSTQVTNGFWIGGNSGTIATPLDLVMDITDTVCPNEPFDVTFKISATSEQPVEGVQMYLKFDPAILQVNSILTGTALDFVLQQSVSAAGYINFASSSFINPPQTNSFDLVTVNFTALQKTSGTQLQVDADNSNLQSQGSYLALRADDTTLAIGDCLKCNVTLQGRANKPDNSWITPLDIHTTEIQSITTDNNGVCNLPTTVSPGNSSFCVKNSHTLANKIGPPINNGTIDLGTLFEGDVDDDNDIDFNDITLLRNALNICSGQNGYNSNADLNNDNCVNNNDVNTAFGTGNGQTSNFGRPSACSLDNNTRTLRRRGVRDGTGSVSLTTTQVPADLPVGSYFDVEIQVNASEAQSIDGTAAYLNFDPNRLQVNNLTAGENFDFVLQSDFDNTKGEINFAATSWEMAFPKGNFALVTVNFTLLNPGGAQTLEFNTTGNRKTVSTSEGKSLTNSENVGEVVMEELILPELPDINDVIGLPDPSQNTGDTENANTDDLPDPDEGDGTVNNQEPVASFTVTPETGTTPLTVTLNASNSTDTDGTITSYKWTASDGQTAEGQNTQLTFNEAGNYTISLEVMDDKGTTNSATSNVSATAPAVVGKYETSGTIKDSSGQPISNATVKVGDKIVITDEAGYWEANGLSDKNYQVEFSKDGYNSKTSTCIFSENQETCQLNFKPESLLDIKETYNSRTAEQGANITYRFIVTNNGKTTATGITLQDILPADTELVSIKSLADSPCDENSISCIIPDLPPKTTTSVEVIIRNTQATALISTASVTSNEYPTDVHTTKTNITPYLFLDITDTPDPLQMGQATLNYKFNIDLNQYSSSSATDIQLNTELPEVMEFKTITSDDATCDTSKLPTITCTIPELTVDNPDKSSHATIDMEVEVQDAGLLVAILDGKVTANEYPDHSNRERTQIFVPLEYQVDMAVVIDVTGSMQQEMNGIKAALRKFMEEIGADQFPLSALVVFRDDVTIKAITSDMNNLIASIDKMKASGGDACEEASIEALDKAIAHVKEGGTIFFVTDASPYNDADVEGVVERLNAKNIKIKPVVTGDCSDRSSWNLPE